MRLRQTLILTTIVLLVGVNGALGRHPDKTGDPRSDILPHPFYNHWSPYRADENRPRFVAGWFAYVSSRTSQEAMSWQENQANGTYHTHKPTPIQYYLYPKPWEVLPTGVRRNAPIFTDATQVNPTPIQTVPGGY